MLSRPRLIARLGSAALLFALAACQAFPAGGALPTSVAPPTATVSATASVFDIGVWARVPFCDCLDGKSTNNISLALDRAQLDGTVKLLSPTGGWMYFVVAFDPKTATREQIVAAIVDGGGEVLAGPP